MGGFGSGRYCYSSTPTCESARHRPRAASPARHATVSGAASTSSCPSPTLRHSKASRPPALPGRSAGHPRYLEGATRRHRTGGPEEPRFQGADGQGDPLGRLRRLDPRLPRRCRQGLSRHARAWRRDPSAHKLRGIAGLGAVAKSGHWHGMSIFYSATCVDWPRVRPKAPAKERAAPHTRSGSTGAIP